MAEVNVKIKAQNQTRTGFQQALGDAQKFGSDANRSLRGSFSAIGNDIRGNIGGALAGIVSLGAIKNIADQFGRINDLSQTFGISAETLQRFGQVASESGASMEELARFMARVERSVVSAQSGTGAAAQAFVALGLSAGQLSKLSPEQKLLAISDALAASTDQGKALAATFDIGGKGALNLINFLRQGSDAIQAQAAGINAASAEIVAKVDEIGDRFSRLGQQISVGLGPAIATLGSLFLGVFEIIQAGVQRLASSITTSILAASRAATGDFRGAGDLLAAEAQAARQEWEKLKSTLSDVNSPAAKRLGFGAAAEDIEGPTNKRGATDPDSIRRQVGDQREANLAAQRSSEEQLAVLKRREAILSKDKGGVSEIEVERLRVVGQILALEKQIAAEKSKGPQFGPGTAEAALGGFRVDAANFAREQQEALLQQAQGSREMTGSSGASALQRIGFASNEFFDTRRQLGPAEIVEAIKRNAEFTKQVAEILKKGEPLVLPSTN
jgi:hypothetical protein